MIFSCVQYIAGSIGLQVVVIIVIIVMVVVMVLMIIVMMIIVSVVMMIMIIMITAIMATITISDADYRGGLYLSSLAVALRKTIQEYHSAVVELELKLMNDPQLPLSQLLLALQPLAPLVAAVSTLVTEVGTDTGLVNHLSFCQNETN